MFFLLLLGLTSCVFDHFSVIPIINYSNKAFIVYMSTKDTLEDPYLGDTLNSFSCFDKDKSRVYVRNEYLEKESKGSIGIFGYRESIFYDSKDGRVRFYFISDSVFMRNTWATIVKHQMYNRKMTFTKEQLDSMGWIIEYK